MAGDRGVGVRPGKASTRVPACRKPPIQCHILSHGPAPSLPHVYNLELGKYMYIYMHADGERESEMTLK